jgi:ABC-type nitrate/sulfonate/bicarbonate transport system substrate-binding protein
MRVLRRSEAARAVVLAALVIGWSGASSDALAADASGGSSASPPANPVTIRMGWGIPEEDIKYVMMKFPEVAPNLGKWYKIQWQQFSGTALGVQGLAAGTLDCATVGGLSVANGIDQGANITLLGEFIEERQPYFSTAWMVKKDSGINSLADLKGKIVATSAVGGSTDYVQDFYIRQRAGLLPNKDYKKVEVPFGQMVETLMSGRADMGLYPQPFYGAINATGKVKPMFRLTDEIDPFVQLLNGCRKDFVDANQETIRKFQEDWVTVARWMADPANRDKVVAADSAATKIPAKVIDGFLLTKQDFFRPKDGAISVDALQEEWEFFRKQGGIKNDYKVRDYLSPLSINGH